MKLLLDVVVPVLIPSEHIEPFQKNLFEIVPGLRINFVMDFAFCAGTPKVPLNIRQPRERVFSGNFASPGAARNEAIKSCDSPYLCFWDIDDFPRPREYMSLIHQMRESNADVGIGKWNFVGERTNPRGNRATDVANFPGVWRFIFRRDFVKDLSFTELNWGEDQLYLMEVFSRNPKVELYDKVLYQYSKYSPGSLTSKSYHVVDLFKANKDGMKLVKRMRGSFRLCGEVMLLRQVYSIFRYGGVRLGFKSLLNYLFDFPSKIHLFASIPHYIYFRKTWKR